MKKWRVGDQLKYLKPRYNSALERFTIAVPVNTEASRDLVARLAT